MIQDIDYIIRERRNIYIYGAGKRGRAFFSVMDKAGYRKMVAGFVVECADDNPLEIEGITVNELERTELDTSFPVYIAIADKKVTESVEKKLRASGFGQVFRADREDTFFLEYIRANSYLRSLDSRIRIEKKEYDEFGFFHLLIDGRSMHPGRICQWRFYYSMLKTQVVIKEMFFPRERLAEAFEDSYGRYLTLAEALSDEIKEDVGKESGSVRVFSAQHVADKAGRLLTLPSFVTPIQVGAALTKEKVCELTDDMGENISALNADFSECTALYYIWKNVKDADYVGLFHYARYMDVTEADLMKLNKAGVDIIVTTPMLVGAPIKDFFCPRYIPKQDWELMERFIIKNYPEYEDTLKEYNKVFCYPGANLSIMRKEIFDEYCTFAFTVMKDVVEYYSNEDIVREDRYAGYLMENLTAMFVMHNKNRYKIAYTDLLYVKKVE